MGPGAKWFRGPSSILIRNRHLASKSGFPTLNQSSNS